MADIKAARGTPRTDAFLHDLLTKMEAIKEEGLGEDFNGKDLAIYLIHLSKLPSSILAQQHLARARQAEQEGRDEDMQKELNAFIQAFRQLATEYTAAAPK